MPAHAQPASPTVAVVVPCYRVRDQVLGVLASLGPDVDRVYCVDDGCPDGSGDLIEEEVSDPRVRVVRHDENRGVGAATLTGYGAAIRDGATVIVKVDGDGQMDPALIPSFVRAILDGRADYTKGNRFFRVRDSKRMPPLRQLGNAALSLMSKFSGGYWKIFDPTNGYTAIHARVARELPFDEIDPGYFFESDMLYHLNALHAVVLDIPMVARYGTERSNLSVTRVVSPFVRKHLANFVRRIGYGYFLRDFNIASVELLLGFAALAFGTTFGVVKWVESVREGVTASAGTVMLAALPIIIGMQLLLNFLSYDMQESGRVPLHTVLPPVDGDGDAGGSGEPSRDASGSAGYPASPGPPGSGEPPGSSGGASGPGARPGSADAVSD